MSISRSSRRIILSSPIVRYPEIRNGRSLVNLFVAFINRVSSSLINTFTVCSTFLVLVTELYSLYVALKKRTLDNFLAGLASVTVMVMTGVDNGSALSDRCVSKVLSRKSVEFITVMYRVSFSFQ